MRLRSHRRARGCEDDCRPQAVRRRLQSYQEVAADYRARFARGALAEKRYYARLPTLRDATRHAGLALNRYQRRHSHQYRLPPSLLLTCARRLETALPVLSRAQSFDVLFRTVADTIGQLPGVGELMVYDTATRIGAKLGLEPQDIYLHRGVRIGARGLGLPTNRATVGVGELPKAFRRMPAYQLEDVLCIYKEDLARLTDAI
jgi:hypothetical protein